VNFPGEVSEAGAWPPLRQHVLTSSIVCEPGLALRVTAVMTCILLGFALCGPTDRSQSLRRTPLQWEIVAIVKALNVVAIEALVADLHPGAQRAYSRQLLDGEPDRLRCGRKAAIAQPLSWAALALCHEQLGRNAVVEWLGLGLYKSIVHANRFLMPIEFSLSCIDPCTAVPALAMLHSTRFQEFNVTSTFSQVLFETADKVMPDRHAEILP
jgi:hypothetical protein